MKRNPSRPGLSYFDANSRRLVTEGPDVLDVKKEIESRWKGVLEVYFDTWDERWIVVEHGADGVDRFVLATKALSMKTVEKLQRIDQAAHRQGDVGAQAEKEHDAEIKRKDNDLSESMGESHEKLFHALIKDGAISRPKVFIPRSV